MKILFDVEHLYYLPQYLPVYTELVRRGADCRFVFHRQEEFLQQIQQIIDTDNLQAYYVPKEDVLQMYQRESPEWIVVGNAARWRSGLSANIRTALLYHGIGVKSCYYDAELAGMHVRFVEGEYRLQELRKVSPTENYVVSGFAKLDPLVTGSSPQAQERRKTVLYAPTYYPSSIELLDDDWPDALSDCTIIIKPHHFTYSGAAYSSQRKKLEKWQRFPNVQIAQVEDYSLLPFMSQADVLVSEASSALFEFAALDRPVVWLDFFKLRWSYRGPLRFRFTKRMDRTILSYADICAHAAKPRDMVKVIRQELEMPSRYSDIRKRYTTDLLGELDGKASVRIADYLLRQGSGADGPQ